MLFYQIITSPLLFLQIVVGGKSAKERIVMDLTCVFFRLGQTNEKYEKMQLMILYGSPKAVINVSIQLSL